MLGKCPSLISISSVPRKENSHCIWVNNLNAMSGFVGMENDRTYVVTGVFERAVAAHCSFCIATSHNNGHVVERVGVEERGAISCLDFVYANAKPTNGAHMPAMQIPWHVVVRFGDLTT
jgi:hypothetical protein